MSKFSKKQILNILYWSGFVAIAVYFAYSKGWIFTNFDSITPKQAYLLLQNDNNVTLLDVRTPEEFAQEHIEGATLIPVQVLSERLAKLQGVKEKQIIVYCHSGNRSAVASRILVKKGFVPLNVKGGITQWKAQGLQVTH
ncbi:MAG: rhodanese-like domain-containing protein [Sulfuricurvum sp.]|uniref:rhodanese-like domain-containing protein n=1 Tax=Sulfuricurvum sp. TaxID=2025608 RepID=UPI002625C9BB|nr:rhodanese-like domain-containing protein [Sulfuricurvum sp.]MDD5160084.1 rhodanese-like domain-containing protein [Sulfuricurvum sp.]